MAARRRPSAPWIKSPIFVRSVFLSQRKPVFLPRNPASSAVSLLPSRQAVTPRHGLPFSSPGAGGNPLLTNPRPVGIICSNQTAMKGKNAFVPLREPVVGANRRGGGADTGPGVARLRTLFQGGTAGPVTGCGLVGGRERPAATAGGTRVVPRKSLRP